MTRTCLHCGATFSSSQARQKFCARPCYYEWFKAYQRARYVPKPVACADCGRDVDRPNGWPRRYCEPCHDAHSLALRRLAKHRGLEAQRRKTRNKIRGLRPVLLERYGARCGPCGRPIDTTLHYLHPMSLTIDHIHPISAGGTDEPGNLWPAHRRCNEEKGDELGWSPSSTLFAA